MSRFMVAASTAAASTFEKGVRGEGMLAEACCPPLELRPEAARQPQPAGGGGGSEEEGRRGGRKEGGGGCSEEEG